MVEMALDMPSKNKVVELDEERRTAMVSNLLLVLCGGRAIQPVVNTGTLYHEALAMGDQKTILLRIDGGVLDALRTWADEELHSLNGQIEHLLRQALREQGRHR